MFTIAGSYFFKRRTSFNAKIYLSGFGKLKKYLDLEI